MEVSVRDPPAQDCVAVVLVERRIEEQVMRVEAVVEGAPRDEEGRDAEGDRKWELTAAVRSRSGGVQKRRPSARA
jgi:hypothetical protein